jgi:hypothetical protein
MKEKKVDRLTFDDCQRLAELHGLESGSDYMIGDLEELCEAMRRAMTDEQWKAVLADPVFGRNFLDGFVYDDVEETVRVPSTKDLAKASG